jgi:hypothetical protein
MRLFTLPDLSVMAPPVAQIAAIALSLGGCSALDNLSGTPANSFYPNPSKLYLTDSAFVTAPKELLDRYVCATAKPLVCECQSRVGSTCDCHC